MFEVIDNYSEGKSATTPSEDLVVVTSSYAAVIDGATPKTGFRFDNNETPGHLAARVIGEAITKMPEGLSCIEIAERLNAELSQHIPSTLEKKNYPTASVAIYNTVLHEVMLIGDCQFATISKDGTFKQYTNRKKIDIVLENWRSEILSSIVTRGVMDKNIILKEDIGRKIIQPFITNQVRYQNTVGGKYSYGVIDGTNTPEVHIHKYELNKDTEFLILASDGFKDILPTLTDSLSTLKKQHAEDPLSIGTLKATKAGYDDRSYLRIKIK